MELEFMMAEQRQAGRIRKLRAYILKCKPKAEKVYWELRKALKPQSSPLVTWHASTKPHILSLLKQTHQLRTNHSNAGDCGGHLIQTATVVEAFLIYRDYVNSTFRSGYLRMERDHGGNYLVQRLHVQRATLPKNWQNHKGLPAAPACCIFPGLLSPPLEGRGA